MNTARIIGLETEYAALVKGSGQRDLAFLFDDLGLPYHARWDSRTERPSCDARGFFPGALAPSDPEPLLELVALPDNLLTNLLQAIGKPTEDVPIHIEEEIPPSVMLPNGARFYLDHTHPELSTPECATPLEVVAYDKACDTWLHELVARVNATRGEQEQVTIYKNNSDAYNNSYGCHENYLMDAAAFRLLFDQRAHRLFTALIPFLVSRQVICGAGRVAPIGDGKEMGFHISQRADFFESILGLQTTHHRPLINTRDEPHADLTRFRRLHVIVGDSNLSEYSTYLKVGSTALVLELLADDRLRLDLTLADPLYAIRAISEDPACRATVELESGGRYTAIDIQRRFLEAVVHYLDEHDDNTYRRQVWQVWAETVENLAQAPSRLATRIDWAIKREFLNAQMDKRGWTWDAPQVRELDVKYHQIDPNKSLYYLLQSKGLVDRLLTDDAVQRAQKHPPETTRASLRMACLARYPDQVVAVNWDAIVFVDREKRVLRWRWGDPSQGVETIAPLMQRAPTLELLAQLVLKSQLADKEADEAGNYGNWSNPTTNPK
jgi:Pup amidohydrolase